MERPFGREIWVGADFNSEVKSGVKEEKEYQELVEAMKEKYCYNSAEKFDDKALSKLAHLERYGSLRKNDMIWEEKEAERCELKKRLEAEVLDKSPMEAAKFWKDLQDKYCNKFDEKIKGEEEYSPKSLKKKKLKRRTILDEEDEEVGKGLNHSKEADDSFKMMMGGIESEMVAHNVLKKVLNCDVKMTNSRTDMNNKIDMIAVSDKDFLAIQVKTSLLDSMRKNGIDMIEEVGPESKEPEKRKLFEGSSRMADELNLKARGVSMKTLWITLPREYKSDGSGAYDLRLEKEAKYRLDKILRKGNA